MLATQDAAPSAHESDELLQMAAQHEAGHAVMRWLRRLPATMLVARADGTGEYSRTGRRVFFGHLVDVLLGGYAAESEYGVWLSVNRISVVDGIDACGAGDDVAEARRLLAGVADDVDARLAGQFADVCRELLQHADLVDRIGWRLARAGELSARSVAALCREHGRRLQRHAEPPR